MGAEVILSLAGAYIFSTSFVSSYTAASVVAGIYAVYGLATAFSDSIPKALNLVHSNFSSILLSIYLLAKLRFDNEAIAFLVMAAPFLIDGAFSLYTVYTAFVMDFSENLKEELLEGSAQEERKFLPILFSRIEKYVYNKTDSEFMPELCNDSFKNNVFKYEGKQFTVQITSGILIFAELYLSIMAAVHSELAPVFSVFVTIYALFSLYSFFGLENSKAVLMSQSYFVTLKLAAVSLGYLFESFRNGGFNYEISFLLMTAVLTFDAFLGFSMLASRQEFSKDTKNFQIMGQKTLAFASDNWKSNLFRANNISDKVAAFVVLSFEVIFALSAFFTFSGFQQVLALLASVYAVSSMVGYFRSNFAQNIFTSYAASFILAAVMMIGFIEFSIAYVMLVTPFVIDAFVGIKKLRQAFPGASEGSFSKITVTKEFVFTSSQVDTI